MNESEPRAGSDEALLFFGTVTASISHELNNSLAVINENAGLLSDLIAMADRGRPIAPERLGIIADRVKRHVGLAEGIITRMNAFAHSTDEPVTVVDVVGVVGLTIALAERISQRHGVTIALGQCTQASAVTSPFTLSNLIWRCLDIGMQTVGDARALAVTVAPGGRGVLIGIAGLAGSGGDPPGAERARGLAEILDATLVFEAGGSEIVIDLPADSFDGRGTGRATLPEG